MIETLNFVLADYAKEEVGSWDKLVSDLKDIGLDGVEGIWDGFEPPEDLPKGLVKGYHLTFFADWLDYYKGNKAELLRKYKTEETVRMFYEGSGAEDLIDRYKKDLGRAKKLGAKYVVFHVSDVATDEVFSYKYRHSNKEVLDASIEIVNEILKDEDSDILFLMENQWWPGLTMNSPNELEYLLDNVNYKHKGIMFDSGHFMNSDLRIKSEADGVAAINTMLGKLGSLAKTIKGMHLHQSLSAEYALAHTGFVPDDFPWDDPMAAFSYAYGHVLKLDRHQPWTYDGIARVVERVEPQFLTHELCGKYSDRIKAAEIQKDTLRRGGLK